MCARTSRIRKNHMVLGRTIVVAISHRCCAPTIESFHTLYDLWRHPVKTACRCPSETTKVQYYLMIMFPIASHRFQSHFRDEERSNRSTSTQSAPNCYLLSMQRPLGIQGFSVSQMRRFCLSTYPLK